MSPEHPGAKEGPQLWRRLAGGAVVCKFFFLSCTTLTLVIGLPKHFSRGRFVSLISSRHVPSLLSAWDFRVVSSELGMLACGVVNSIAGTNSQLTTKRWVVWRRQSFPHGT